MPLSLVIRVRHTELVRVTQEHKFAGMETKTRTYFDADNITVTFVLLVFRNFVRCVFSPEMNYSCTVVTQKSNHMWEMFLIGGGVLVFVAYVAF